MSETKEVVKKVAVVTELPTTKYREVSSEDGTIYECITIEEALTEILESIREIKSKL